MGRKKKIKSQTEANVEASMSDDEKRVRGYKTAKGKPKEHSTASVEGVAPPTSEPVDEGTLDQIEGGAASEDSTGTFMNPVEKKKRKYAKRKGKEEAPPAQSPAEQLEATKVWVKPVIGIMSTAGARIAEDERGLMTPSELDVIVNSTAGCIQQYLPDILGKHGNAVVLCVFMTQWTARVYLVRQENLARLRAQKAAGRHAANAEYNDTVVHQTGGVPGNGTGLPA